MKALVQFSPREAGYLERQMVGRLATASKKGAPHVAPICFASNSEKIFIHTGRGSKKMRNILENRRVAFVADEYLSWEKNRGVIVQGVAEVLERGEEYELGRVSSMANILSGSRNILLLKVKRFS